MGSSESWEFEVAPPRTAPGATSMVGYRTAASATALHRGLPSSRLTFIVSLDEGVTASAEERDLAAAHPLPVVLGGLHLTTSYVRQELGQAGIQLAVHPLASRALFGRPSAELSVEDFDGLAHLGPTAGELHARVAEAADWPRAFRLVADHLTGHLDERRQGALRAEVARAWQLLERSGGRVPIEILAAEVGLGRRQLDAHFLREVGRSPKAVAGLIRFEHATRLLSERVRRGGELSLGAIAARAGYADQAHLTRDFTRRAGVPPRRWVAEERRNVQDGGHRAEAG